MSELVQYVQEMYSLSEKSALVFKLANLHNLLKSRLILLGAVDVNSCLNHSRIKEDLLQLVPGLVERKCGREFS